METNNKLREALKDIGRFVEQIHLLYSDYPSEIHEIARKVNAALAEPVKNCEVGTAEEQTERWNNENPYPYDWDDRQYYDALDMLKWAQMPYEEGGAK